MRKASSAVPCSSLSNRTSRTGRRWFRSTCRTEKKTPAYRKRPIIASKRIWKNSALMYSKVRKKLSSSSSRIIAQDSSSCSRWKTASLRRQPKRSSTSTSSFTKVRNNLDVAKAPTSVGALLFLLGFFLAGEAAALFFFFLYFPCAGGGPFLYLLL